MNTVHINIIDSYWEDTGIEFCETNSRTRFSKTITIDTDIEIFERQLHILIMEQKNDGLQLERNTYGDLHIIDTFLLLGEEDDSEYNIDYIINYLDKFPEGEFTNNNEKIDFENFIFIRFADIEDISAFLKEDSIDFNVITETNVNFQRGADNFWLDFLIGISQNASWDFIKAVGGKLKQKFSDSHIELQLGSLNVNKLRNNVSEIGGIDEKELILISFTEISEDRYSVEFRSPTIKINVIATSDGDIADYKRKKMRVSKD